MRNCAVFEQGVAAGDAGRLRSQRGCDLPHEPIEDRKPERARLLTGVASRSRSSSTASSMTTAPTVIEHACKLGCEGIVSKRRGSIHSAGRSPNWLKLKNADAPAVWREGE
jgi:ATP-dependent DNA ligase